VQSSVDTCQADALNSKPAFTSTRGRGDWLRSPGNVLTVVVASGSEISTRSGVVSSLIIYY
jgi:hypothetical protein